MKRQVQYVTVRDRTRYPFTRLSKLLSSQARHSVRSQAATGSANEKPEESRRREPDHATRGKPAQGIRKPAMPSGTYGSVRLGFEFLTPLGIACARRPVRTLAESVERPKRKR